MAKQIIYFLIILFFIIGCSSPDDAEVNQSIGLFYVTNDSLGFKDQILNDHHSVRRQIEHVLDSIILSKSTGDNYSEDSLTNRAEWFVRHYTKASSIYDLLYRLNFLNQWDSVAATQKMRLDSSFQLTYKKFRSSQTDSIELDTYTNHLSQLMLSYDSLGDSISMATMLFFVAEANFNNNRTDQAKQYFHECAKLAQKFDLYSRLGFCNYYLSLLNSRYEGDLYQAEKQLSEAASCFKKSGDTQWLATIKMQQANNQRALSSFYEAIKKSEEASRYYFESNDELRYSYCLYLIAECYYDLNRNDSSLHYAEQALSVRTKYYDRLRKGDKQSAAMKAHASIANVISLKALNYHALGDFNQATKAFESADSIFQKYTDTTDICLNRGRWAWLLVEQKDFNKANTLLEQNLESSVRFEDWFDAVLGLATCSYYKNDFDRTKELLITSIEHLESIQATIGLAEIKAGSIADKMRAYDLLTSVFLEEKLALDEHSSLDSALYFIDIRKYRTLRESLTNGERSLPSSEIANLINRKSELLAKLIIGNNDDLKVRSELDTLNSSLYSLRLSQEVLEKQIPGDSPSVSHLLKLARPSRKDRASLIYQLSPYGCYSILITQDTVCLNLIDIKFDSLTTLIKLYHEAISNFPNSESKWVKQRDKLGKTLYGYLIPLCLQSNSNIDDISVLPSDLLHLLPIETLIDSDGKYLCEKYYVDYKLSLTNNHNSRSDKKSNKKMVVIGNPILPSEGRFRKLKSAQREIDLITELYENETTTLAGSNATKAQFKKFDFATVSLVHVASHSICDFKSPSQSGILFSSEDSNRAVDLLTVPEISAISIPVDLVFLSSCQSGTGTYLAGEGLMGMARPFFEAGASATIVSLWEVDDRATTVFVGDFYEDLRLPNNQSSALNNARQSMIESDVPLYRHPFFWASFVLIRAD